MTPGHGGRRRTRRAPRAVPFAAEGATADAGLRGRRSVPQSTAVRRVRSIGPAFAVVLAVFVAVGASAADEESVEERLAGASPERGQEVFLVCRACHTIEEGAVHTIGPNLWGVLDRPVASAEGYDRYTPAMVALGGDWSPERLDRYLRQPMEEVKGTTMAFPGVPGPRDRADLIAWLNRNSPAPRDLGAGRAAESGQRGSASRPAPALDFGLLVAGEGVRETHAYCTACHSERIVVQQGLTRPDWEELLEQMVEEHEMEAIEEPDLARVLGYLATHYGPDRPNFPKR